MIPIKFNDMNLGEDIMSEKLKLDLECSEMEFKIEPYGYEEKDNVYCELKFSFQTNPTEMIELLKLYRDIADIQKQHYSKDENGDPVYLSDIYNLKLQFLRFEEEKI